jgi:hypothetical protein
MFADNSYQGFTGVALVNIISFGENVKWVVLQW